MIQERHACRATRSQRPARICANLQQSARAPLCDLWTIQSATSSVVPRRNRSKLRGDPRNVEAVGHSSRQLNTAQRCVAKVLRIKNENLRGPPHFIARIHEDVSVVFVPQASADARDEDGLSDTNAHAALPDERLRGTHIVLRDSVEPGHGAVAVVWIKRRCIAEAERLPHETFVHAREVAWYFAKNTLVDEARLRIDAPLGEPLLLGMLHVHVPNRYLRLRTADHDNLARTVFVGVHDMEAHLPRSRHLIPFNVLTMAMAREDAKPHRHIIVEVHRALAFQQVRGQDERAIQYHRVVSCHCNVVHHDVVRQWNDCLVHRAPVSVPNAVSQTGRTAIVEPHQLACHRTHLGMGCESLAFLERTFRGEVRHVYDDWLAPLLEREDLSGMMHHARVGGARASSDARDVGENERQGPGRRGGIQHRVHAEPQNVAVDEAAGQGALGNVLRVPLRGPDPTVRVTRRLRRTPRELDRMEHAITLKGVVSCVRPHPPRIRAVLHEVACRKVFWDGARHHMCAQANALFVHGRPIAAQSLWLPRVP
mmetsp:Transcript_47374/g.144130  ORF Transcript_47374/g.144130 Transcript_47374/m.144130 type:complete len:539 (-) Transcript_47374:326-1942(-)